MSSPIDRLLSHAGPALGRGTRSVVDEDAVPAALRELLSVRDGFYAFGGALLVRPVGACDDVADVRAWNDANLWRAAYDFELSRYCFFAEDVFGGQFAVVDDGIYRFDPETAACEKICETIQAWCERIVAERAVETGEVLLKEWQTAHGALPRAHRLVPRIPFVCGGEYEVHNLVCMRDVDAMRARANLANQIRDLPDGAEVRFRIV